MEEGKEKNKIDKTLLLLTCTARYLTHSLSLSLEASRSFRALAYSSSFSPFFLSV